MTAPDASVLGVPLRLAARHGPILLVAGLVAGMTLPGLARGMKAWLPELVGSLLFLAALRIGPRAAFGALRDLPVTLGLVLLYQTVLPVLAVGVALAGGWQAMTLATALVLMLSAPSISGSPNITVMTGNDPTPALRLLLLGTLALPLTVLPVLWLLPALGTVRDVVAASLRLLVLIGIAGGLGFAVRALLLPRPSPSAVAQIDGLSAIALGVVVIALMSAVAPALVGDPWAFASWMAIAFAANFGLQIAAAFILARSPLAEQRVPLAIIAGNRNIALFLAALPASVTDPILLFIGCYQFPMYLTPILLRRLFRRTEPASPPTPDRGQTR